MRTFTMPARIAAHVHFRRGIPLDKQHLSVAERVSIANWRFRLLMEMTLRDSGIAVIEPNTDTKIFVARDAQLHYDECRFMAELLGYPDFDFRMLMYLTNDTTPAEVVLP